MQASTNRIADARGKGIFRPGNLITAVNGFDSGKLLIFIHQTFSCKMNIVEYKKVASIKKFRYDNINRHETHVAVLTSNYCDCEFAT